MKPGSDRAQAVQDLLTAVRRAARQEQFLEVVSPEEAHARFTRNLQLTPLPGEAIAVGEALGRTLAADIAAPIDVPPFDRSGVDGFAVRAGDIAGATEATPCRLLLNSEVIACGHQPMVEVPIGTATTIATGGAIPRGADAIVMIEHTELVDTAHGPAIDIRRAAIPGQFVGFAGTDIARGETLLRRGTQLTSREIGMLAACGLARVDVVRRPKVAVLSTGDELVQPGEPLRAAAIYDSNNAIIAAAVAEAGGEPIVMGSYPDDEPALTAAIGRALAAADIVVISGGTSKGAGDLSHQVVSSVARGNGPGILVHGVALKPGKPLCLAVIGGKPVAVLPGFPTSAIFTFHAFVAPVIRARAGLPGQTARNVKATVPVRIASELGRQEFVLVALTPGADGPVAFPIAKGSGSVTAFSQADGFLSIDAQATTLDAGSSADVTLIGNARLPDLVIMGSHCVALDAVLSALAEQGILARSIAVGSMGGAAAVSRGECDLAPVHLLDPTGTAYNTHLVRSGLSLVRGWERMQGVIFRANDKRFSGNSATQALAGALADPACIMVNRNAGAGTRILIDRVLGGARPAGYANQPRSHNAAAAAVAQGRADWGIAIEPVARMYDLGFLPIAPEHYDFLISDARRERPAVRAFLAALRDPAVRYRIRALGMQPAEMAPD